MQDDTCSLEIPPYLLPLLGLDFWGFWTSALAQVLCDVRGLGTKAAVLEENRLPWVALEQTSGAVGSTWIQWTYTHLDNHAGRTKHQRVLGAALTTLGMVIRPLIGKLERMAARTTHASAVSKAVTLVIWTVTCLVLSRRDVGRLP